MSLRSLLTDTRAVVPDVSEPTPATDRGLPDAVGVSLIAFAVVLLTIVGAGWLTGDPVTWHAAPGVVSNALTAAAIAAGFGWLRDSIAGS